jgi:hypothetical protein
MTASKTIRKAIRPIAKTSNWENEHPAKQRNGQNRHWLVVSLYSQETSRLCNKKVVWWQCQLSNFPINRIGVWKAIQKRLRTIIRAIARTMIRKDRQLTAVTAISITQ